jgi:hypothetical protein
VGDPERHDFESEEAFYAFVQQRGFADAFERTRAAMDATAPAREQAEQLKRKTERIARELDELAERLALPPNSPDLFAKATVARAPDEREIFDATTLFDGSLFQGARCPVFGDVYDLNLLGGWRSRPRSLYTDRPLVLCSNPGYGGLQYWLFAPAGNFTAINDLGWFNNLAASILYLR